MITRGHSRPAVKTRQKTKVIRSNLHIQISEGLPPFLADFADRDAQSKRSNQGENYWKLCRFPSTRHCHCSSCGTRWMGKKKKLCSSLICGLLSKFKWISTDTNKIASSVHISILQGKSWTLAGMYGSHCHKHHKYFFLYILKEKLSYFLINLLFFFYLRGNN